MNKTMNVLGFWSSLLSALFGVLWFVTYAMRDVFATMPDWHDVEAYAEAFTSVRFLYIYPSLLLAVSFVVMLACIHRKVSDDKKIWSLVGLAFGILYATMASVNYNIQAMAVRQSLIRGETEGITFFLPDNPYSAFGAMANSYVYMALAMVFVGFVFQKGRLERYIRFLFFAQVITIIGQVGWSMFDLSMGIFLATSFVWVIGAPVGFFLLALVFRRDLLAAGDTAV